ncbi:alpha/beta hydrolase [Nocardia beijingensis]|uniref:alpha/beta hydrolase n=1 Tax=Nocardia beijingensis TaxID=95162 RepID=UPI0033E95417
MTSAATPPATRPNPTVRFRQYRHYHPDLRPYALALPRETVSGRMLPLMRRLAARTRPHPAAAVTDLGDGARVRVFGDTGSRVPGPALLWIHGGGYVFGTAAQDDRWCHQIATRTGVLVASVDYRLAPEHPYPAALHDCHRALHWLADQPGVDPGRVILAGASAGGGLAAAHAAHTRDHGPVTPLLQLLLYPMLDHTPLTATGTWHRLWGPRSNAFAWNSYLADADPAHAVPAHRPDLAGLPPAWIAVGDLDLLHDQNARYHLALTAAEVDSRLTVIPGAFHGFDTVAPTATISRDLRRSALHTIHTSVTTPPPR